MRWPRTYLEDHYTISSMLFGVLGALATIYGIVAIANFVDVDIRDGIVGGALASVFALGARYAWGCARAGAEYKDESGEARRTWAEVWVGAHPVVVALPVMVILGLALGIMADGVGSMQAIRDEGYTWGEIIGAYLMLSVVVSWCGVGLWYINRLRREVSK